MSNQKKIKPKKKEKKSFLEQEELPLFMKIIMIAALIYFLLVITLCRNGTPDYDNTYYPGKPYFPHENTRR